MKKKKRSLYRMIMTILAFTFAAIVIFSVLAYLYSNTPISDKEKEDIPIIVAHRGSSGVCPENTLAAIKQAIQDGADWIEIDVHLSKDNRVIVIHDPKLDRTTDGQGFVSDHTFEEISSLDAGSWFSPEFSEEAVPDLLNVLMAVDGKCQVLIELKNGHNEPYLGLTEAVLEVIDQYKAQNWVVLQSFEEIYIKELQAYAHKIPVHKLLITNIPLLPLYLDTKLRIGNIYKQRHIKAINPYYKFLNRRYIYNAHKVGLEVYCYTINEVAEMKQAMKYGVDGIITNYPARLKDLLENTHLN